MRASILFIILVIQFAGCDTAPDPAAEMAYDEARRAVEAGDGELALDLFLTAAELNHLGAQLALGSALEYGHFSVEDPLQPSVAIRQDPTGARQWRERAFELASERAKTGDAEARLALASFLIMGMDLSTIQNEEEEPERQAEGIALLDELESEGNADAAHQLGIFALLAGHDVEKAIVHYRRAAELGHEHGYTQLALVTGMLYPDDLATGTVERIRVLREGAEAGNEVAKADLEQFLTGLAEESVAGNPDASEIQTALDSSGVLDGWERG